MKAIHVECPVCGANIGELCRTIDHMEMPESHFKRKLAALAKPPATVSNKPSAKSSNGDGSLGVA